MVAIRADVIRNCGRDKRKHELAVDFFRETWSEVAFRAGLSGDYDTESLAKEFADDLNVLREEHDEEVGRLEADIEEYEVCRDEIEEAIADKFSWEIAGKIMQDARDKGRERRQSEKESRERLAS